MESDSRLPMLHNGTMHEKQGLHHAMLWILWITYNYRSIDVIAVRREAKSIRSIESKNIANYDELDFLVIIVIHVKLTTTEACFDAGAPWTNAIPNKTYWPASLT